MFKEYPAGLKIGPQQIEVPRRIQEWKKIRKKKRFYGKLTRSQDSHVLCKKCNMFAKLMPVYLFWKHDHEGYNQSFQLQEYRDSSQGDESTTTTNKKCNVLPLFGNTIWRKNNIYFFLIFHSNFPEPQKNFPK